MPRDIWKTTMSHDNPVLSYEEFMAGLEGRSLPAVNTRSWLHRIKDLVSSTRESIALNTTHTSVESLGDVMIPSIPNEAPQDLRLPRHQQ